MTGICPMCGAVGRRGELEHAPDCVGGVPVLWFRKRRNPVQTQRAACDELARRLVAWRDDCECVLAGLDGDRCRGGGQWGHVIPQKTAPGLVYDLGNSFRQCAGHNLEHKFYQLLYYRWHQHTFGLASLDRLAAVARVRQPMTLPRMQETRGVLAGLYAARHRYEHANTTDLVAAGYYGEHIRAEWEMSGRV